MGRAVATLSWAFLSLSRISLHLGLVWTSATITLLNSEGLQSPYRASLPATHADPPPWPSTSSITCSNPIKVQVPTPEVLKPYPGTLPKSKSFRWPAAVRIMLSNWPFNLGSL